MAFESLVLATTLQQPPKETSFRVDTGSLSIRSNYDSDISNAIDNLTDLQKNENVDDSIFKPTIHAYLNAREKLLEVHKLMGSRFFYPLIVSDGEGGVDLEWECNERTIILSCRAEYDQQDHIYHEKGNEYDSKEYSLAYLKDRLDWLINKA